MNQGHRSIEEVEEKKGRGGRHEGKTLKSRMPIHAPNSTEGDYKQNISRQLGDGHFTAIRYYDIGYVLLISLLSW